MYPVTLGRGPSATTASRTVHSTNAKALGDYAYNAILTKRGMCWSGPAGWPNF
jgi:hypothetical protein